MKITKSYLKKIIKEEINRLNEEQSDGQEPDISHIKRGVLAPHPQGLDPVFLGIKNKDTGEKFYLYKVAFYMGGEQPSPKYDKVVEVSTAYVDNKQQNYSSAREFKSFGPDLGYKTAEEALEAINKPSRQTTKKSDGWSARGAERDYYLSKVERP